MSTAELLRLYARQLEDQHAPQNITIGLREAADELDASRETTLQLLGQVGQLSDEIYRLRQVLHNTQQARVLQGKAIIDASNEIERLKEK